MLAFAQASHAYFEDLILVDGTAYTNVFVTRVEPDGLSFMHGHGVAKFYFHELSEDIRHKYNYDPVMAITYWYDTQLAQQEWEQRQLEASRLEAEEHQKRLDEIQLREAALKAQGGPKVTNVKLMQIQEDGSWICRPFKYEKGAFTLGRATYVKRFEESQILVEGLPTNMADNDEWRGRIYEVGIHQIQSERGPIRTLRKYKVLP